MRNIMIFAAIMIGLGTFMAQIAAKIRRIEAGLPVSGVVDRTRFY